VGVKLKVESNVTVCNLNSRIRCEDSNRIQKRTTVVARSFNRLGFEYIGKCVV
jgi:hypothetical protein